MVISAHSKNESQFLLTHIPELLKRFTLLYQKDDSCIEYFLFSKEKNIEISKSLILSHNMFSHSINVSKFYPEIYKEICCKYLSAACFYLIVHHAANKFHMADTCSVGLEAEKKVFESFYSKLNDFNFKINYNRPAKKVCLKGRYQKYSFKTDMIHTFHH